MGSFSVETVVVLAIGIATGYGLDEREVGVRVPVRARFSSSPRCPDRFWGPPSLLSNVNRFLFLRDKAAGVEADHHLQLVPRSRKRGSIHPIPPYVFLAYCFTLAYSEWF
jgi:hypothetical protein